MMDRTDITKIVFSIAMLLMVFFCICTYLLLRGKNRKEAPNLLAASIMIHQVIFILIYFSGVLHLFGYQRHMSKPFCWLFLHIDLANMIFVPYSLFMFTIERLIFIKDPVGYNQKMTKIGIIAMLVIPWVLSFIIASTEVIASSETMTVVTYQPYRPPTNMSEIGNETMNNNVTVHVCYLRGMGSSIVRHYIVTILLLIPILASLVCAVTVLVMWCCFRYKHAKGTDYAMMGDEILVNVRLSVIAVANLNIWFIVLGVVLNAFVYLGHPSGFTLYGIIQGIVFMATFINVRQTIAYYCCLCCKKSPGPHSQMRYKVGDEEMPS